MRINTEDFDLSWIGGGSDDTRLSDGFGGSNPPNTTNTMDLRPSMLPEDSIAHNEFLILLPISK